MAVRTLTMKGARFDVPELTRLRQFSVEDYHRMIDAGVLGPSDRVELINGWIINKMPQDPPHSASIRWLLNWLFQSVDLAKWSIQSQQPISLHDDNEPEPDFSIIANRNYGNAHPTAKSVRLIIEVSDSSLRFDRREKLQVYAANAIPEYWIVNLTGRRVEVYSNPSPEDAAYRTKLVFGSKQSVPLPCAKVPGATLPVEAFLKATSLS